MTVLLKIVNYMTQIICNTQTQYLSIIRIGEIAGEIIGEILRVKINCLISK